MNMSYLLVTMVVFFKQAFCLPGIHSLFMNSKPSQLLEPKILHLNYIMLMNTSKLLLALAVDCLQNTLFMLPLFIT